MSDQRPPIIRLDSQTVEEEDRAAAAKIAKLTAEITDSVVTKVAELVALRTALEMQGKSKGDSEWDEANEAILSYVAPARKTETTLVKNGRSSRLTPPPTDDYGRMIEDSEVKR